MEMVLDILNDVSAGPLGDMELELDDDYINVDNIGLLGAAGFFGDIASVVCHIDGELEELDYQISTANAYVMLASLIQYGIEMNHIEPHGWEDIADRFLTRAQDFSGVRDYVNVVEVFEGNAEWSSILSYLTHNWDVKTKAYARNDFTTDEKIQMIRSTLIGLRARGWLDYTKPWAKTFIAALQEDWVHFGGVFGQGMGTGNNPWSHG